VRRGRGGRIARRLFLGLVGSAGSDAKGAVTALCAAKLGIAVDAIVSTELMLYDLTPPVLGGLSGELLFSARLDNQAMCHAGITAITAAASKVDDRDLVPLAVLFDHEEIGSGSAYGAEAPILPALIERIVLGTGGTRDAYHRAIAGSLCVSADMAHAVHPNYVDRHEARHRVALNGGPVIKVNSQLRYAA